jgi:hypothetical protein
MKWILYLPMFFLLSSCILVENSIISEPKDIVVTEDINKYVAWERCGLVDVTNPSN